jgi:glucose-6-phosphate isomerase
MKKLLTENVFFWGIYGNQIQEWMEKSEKISLIKRLWDKDPTLWTKNKAQHPEIKERLGWLNVAQTMKSRLSELQAFQEKVHQAGYTHAVLLGMGGSGLTGEVMQAILENAPGYPALLLLDSTDPAKIKDTETQIDLSKTLFIVSSKSGDTIESIALLKYFFDRIKKQHLQDPGRQFIAITDPGSSLEKIAAELGFAHVFLAPTNVGGRFSALTVFGLIPACVIGADVTAILESAEKMMEACSSEISSAENTALGLGLGMAILAESGRDKLTLLSSQKLESFGDWMEQLVAESTGKEGVGIVPVVHEEIKEIEHYGPDRFFVALLLESESNDKLLSGLSALEKAGHPVLTLRLREVSDLGGEFFRWEMATAIACALMKINAFDQPDVQAAKECAKKFLDHVKSGGSVRIRQTEISLEEFWENAEPGDYAAILAFLPDRKNVHRRLLELRDTIRQKTLLASTLGFGPRYLHSTGQLHKGGANKGVYILLTAPSAEDLAIPGEPYTFGQLELAQAMGDFEALESKARWLVHLRLEQLSDTALDKVCAEIENAISAPVQ